MTQVLTATFDNGILRPDEPLLLSPGERVRLILEPLNAAQRDHAVAWEEFEKLCEEAPIHSGGERMTRDELHERR